MCVNAFNHPHMKINMDNVRLYGNAPAYVQPVDMGCQILWSNVNLGASAPWQVGKRYAWGEPEPDIEFSADRYLSNDVLERISSPSFLQKRYTETEYRGKLLKPQFDAANIHWGGRWRIPTFHEWDALIGLSTIELTKQGCTLGHRITSRITGNSIFIPFTQLKSSNNEVLLKVEGYWSSSYGVNDSAWAYMNNHNMNFEMCYAGLCLRPVWVDND